MVSRCKWLVLTLLVLAGGCTSPMLREANNRYANPHRELRSGVDRALGWELAPDALGRRVLVFADVLRERRGERLLTLHLPIGEGEAWLGEGPSRPPPGEPDRELLISDHLAGADPQICLDLSTGDGVAAAEVPVDPAVPEPEAVPDPHQVWLTTPYGDVDEDPASIRYRLRWQGADGALRSARVRPDFAWVVRRQSTLAWRRVGYVVTVSVDAVGYTLLAAVIVAGHMPTSSCACRRD